MARPTCYRHQRDHQKTARASLLKEFRVAADGSRELHQRIKRTPPRNNLCTTDEGDAIKYIRGKTVVVWWYERFQKNHIAGSIPFVDVVFRYLDRNDEPAGITVAQIGVSRLGSFRLGTIWKDGICVAETDLGKDERFTVDFTEGAWSYLTVFGTEQTCPFFKTDYPLRRGRTPEALSELLDFPLPNEKNLLIPCVEFLYRCYGSTSDMARILATYPWDQAVHLLYASTEKDVNTWLVQPSSNVPDDDALFLASAHYDQYAQESAKLIYAQLDNAHGNGIKAKSLRARPWFQGFANLKVRGRWINDGKTFLCFEVTGMSQPLDRSYEIRREKHSKQDPEQGEMVSDISKVKIELPKDQDPFLITDLLEPDHGTSPWSKPDPGFEILGPRCSFTTSYVERSFSERRVVQVQPNTAKTRSTGDAQGYNKSVSKVTFVAKRVLGDGGILTAVWKELERLKTERMISSLAWYSAKDGFVESCAFSVMSLPDFTTNDSPKDKTLRWLVYTANANLVRGILVARVEIADRTFYLLELQRKKVLNHNAYEEEKISGLLMEINNAVDAAIEISRICDEIRFANGNFKKLETPINHPHWIFRHQPSVSSTLYNAFLRRGVRLDSKSLKAVSPKSDPAVRTDVHTKAFAKALAEESVER